MIVWVPRVAMKGGTCSLVTMKPLIRPQHRPMISTTISTRPMFISGAHFHSLLA